MKDEHGYPTEEALGLIKEWDSNDQPGMMAFVKQCWWMPEWGWDEDDGKNFLNKDIRIFNISTGGWSGNEDLIGAMQENMIFWMMSWYSSRVGGHYVFKVRL